MNGRENFNEAWQQQKISAEWENIPIISLHMKCDNYKKSAFPRYATRHTPEQ